MISVVCDFGELPENSYNLTVDTVLVASDLKSPSMESGQEFLKAVGGDNETVITIMGMAGDVVYGLPFGKIPFVPEFIPSWTLDQLCQEINLGVWKVISKDNEEYQKLITERALASPWNLVADRVHIEPK